jgi:hypothetical protein
MVLNNKIYMLQSIPFVSPQSRVGAGMSIHLGYNDNNMERKKLQKTTDI